jgi:hypothetical protein
MVRARDHAAPHIGHASARALDAALHTDGKLDRGVGVFT